MSDMKTKKFQTVTKLFRRRTGITGLCIAVKSGKVFCGFSSPSKKVNGGLLSYNWQNGRRR